MREWLNLVMALYIVGMIGVLVSIIIGIFSGDLQVFLLTLLGGIILAIIQFALANVLERQQTIL